jgi:F-type H+-transporting ATPase subunit b
MLIDWFTVGAQALNFLILVWLLKRFLYKPVLDAIDGRERRIQLETGAAAAKLLEAQAQIDDFKSKNAAFDRQRTGMIAEVTEQNSTQREHFLAEAHQEADALRAQYASTMLNDRARLGREIARLAGIEVFGIARKALADLADANLQERMSEAFVRRLQALSAEAKKSLAAAISSSSEPAQLSSGLELCARDRARIQNALNESLATEVAVRFVTAPDSICGIELRTNGQMLAWSIADYLDTLQQKACALLETANAPPTATPAASAAA